MDRIRRSRARDSLTRSGGKSAWWRAGTHVRRPVRRARRCTGLDRPLDRVRRWDWGLHDRARETSAARLFTVARSRPPGPRVPAFALPGRRRV